LFRLLTASSASLLALADALHRSILPLLRLFAAIHKSPTTQKPNRSLSSLFFALFSLIRTVSDYRNVPSLPLNLLLFVSLQNPSGIGQSFGDFGLLEPGTALNSSALFRT
jgi:hypothetical protein